MKSRQTGLEQGNLPAGAGITDDEHQENTMVSLPQAGNAPGTCP